MSLPDPVLQLCAATTIMALNITTMRAILHFGRLQETEAVVVGLGLIVNVVLCIISSMCAESYPNTYFEFCAVYTHVLSALSLLLVVTYQEDGQGWRRHWTWRHFWRAISGTTV